MGIVAASTPPGRLGGARRELLDGRRWTTHRPALDSLAMKGVVARFSEITSAACVRLEQRPGQLSSRNMLTPRTWQNRLEAITAPLATGSRDLLPLMIREFARFETASAAGVRTPETRALIS